MGFAPFYPPYVLGAARCDGDSVPGMSGRKDLPDLAPFPGSAGVLARHGGGPGPAG
jgi:hypothetical protein